MPDALEVMVENPATHAADAANSTYTVIAAISAGGCSTVSNTDIAGIEGVTSFTLRADGQVDWVADQASILAWNTTSRGKSISLQAERACWYLGCTSQLLVGAVFD